VRSLAAWLALLLLAIAPLRGDDSLADARRAQAMLGPDVWSRVIRVENDTRSGRYPPVLHALVFELADLLWFYTDVDGTQSLSTYRGRLEADKADLGPLLREIDRGFRHWREVPGTIVAPGTGRLPNGCFVESVVALREQLARGAEAQRPQLLAFYADTPWGTRGHTVLTFENGGGLTVIDPEQSAPTSYRSNRLSHDPLALARLVGGERVTRARFLPFAPPPVWTHLYASAPGAGGDAPEAGVRRLIAIR
jgi:hypothetical protein